MVLADLLRCLAEGHCFIVGQDLTSNIVPGFWCNCAIRVCVHKQLREPSRQNSCLFWLLGFQLMLCRVYQASGQTLLCFLTICLLVSLRVCLCCWYGCMLLLLLLLAVVVVVVVVVDSCRFCSRSCWCHLCVVTTLLLLPLSSALYSRLAARHRFSIDPYKVVHLPSFTRTRFTPLVCYVYCTNFHGYFECFPRPAKYF